jgi:hypothetical protein
MPSRPGEFRLESFTDPDVILSHHPARATEPKDAAFRRKSELILPPAGSLSTSVRIPTQRGQVFRFHRGHDSDLIAATVPI